ncbi:MAG: transglycosylase SLT domain-containing protein [Gammaproteobacteria bacterium]|nr:transglycosylase SLT domain-containing protein [Gammaproteobacteria bacterium]
MATQRAPGRRSTVHGAHGFMLLCAIWVAALAGEVHGAAAEPLDRSAERALYREALADLYAVRLRAFESKLERLEDYPLLPYLHYARLLRYISNTEPAEVIAFRERFADSHLANSILNHWLDNLARRGQWDLYRQHFDPRVATSATLQCRYYRSLYETGDRAGALAGAARMWVASESRPDVCDPLFDAWRRAGGLTDALAWERITLVLAANRPTLAGYLLRYLDPASERLAQEFIALHRQPQRLNGLASLPGEPARRAEVVAHVVKRLARQDPQAAETAWRTWSSRVELDAQAQQQIAEEILRWRIRRDLLPENFSSSWPPDGVTGEVDATLVEELTRRAIAGEDWDEVLIWIERLPPVERERAGWMYWQARASEAIYAAHNGAAPPPRALPPDASRALFAAVAQQRNYYGFMAADRLGQPVNMQAETLDLTAAEIEAVAQQPAIKRARELYAMDERLDARRELSWLRGRLDTRGLLALAELARRQGWHSESIQATIAAREWNHLDLRFPLAFAEPMQANARLRQLEPSWLFAIARQESAFMVDARSHAGALGVMQVMPATAQLTARQMNIPLANTWQLLDHNKNIEIGAGYLARMYERYGRNRILASAAYNAGPGRVDQWLARRPASPADVWIEAIPFRETRGYVQNVLAFALIYSERLGTEQPFIHDHER